MRILSFFLTLASIAIPHTHAFTYGSLLMPSYMCGAMQPADGTGEIQPSTLGGVFNRFAKGGSYYIQKNQPPQYVEPLVVHTPAYMIAAMHNRNPDFNFTAPDWGDFSTIGLNLTDDTPLPVTGAKVTITTPLTSLSPDNTIYLGQTVNLLPYTIYATYNTSKLNQTLVSMGYYDPIGYWAQSISLEGLILYATDDWGNKIGSFVSAGKLMTPWHACGAGDVGIIHTSTIGGGWKGPGSVYPGIVWLAPYWLPANVTRVHFQGYGVSNHGYGRVNYTFNLNRAPAIPTPTPPPTVATMNTLQCGLPQTNPCFAACAQCASKSQATSTQAYYTCTRVPRVSNVALNYTGQYQATCLDMNSGMALINVTDLAQAGTPVNEGDFANIFNSPQYYMNPTSTPTSSNPTIVPTTPSPTVVPTTAIPTTPAPTATPTTAVPTIAPTTATTTAVPTVAPTTAPTTAANTSIPTCKPTIVYVTNPPADPNVPPVIPTPQPTAIKIVARNDAMSISTMIVGMITCVSMMAHMS